MPKVYAVKVGRVPGLYASWTEASAQVAGFSGAVHKSFAARELADAWLRDGRTRYDTKSNTTQTVRSVKAIPATAAAVGAQIVYADGSCLGNGTPQARAGIGVWFGPADARNVSARLPVDLRQTNQTAELYAAQCALNLVPPEQEVVVRTDSKYVIGAMTQWRHAWMRKQWVTTPPLANLALLRALSDTVEARMAATHWEYVPGHCGEPGNEAADALARAGAGLDM